MINNILFPTDFSLHANYNALRYAVEIAKKSGAKLYLYHAYHGPIDESSTENEKLRLQPGARDKINKNFEELYNYIEQIVGKTPIEVRDILQYGWLHNQISSIVEKKDIDMVVMATKGVKGIQKLMAGSNTTNIIDEVNCPLLAIPEQSEFQGLDNILYAADLEREIPDHVLKQLVAFARLFHSTLYFLHVSPVQKKSKLLYDQPPASFEEIKKRIDYPHVLYKDINEDDLIAGLEEELNTGMIKLLAMTHHQRPFWQRLFNRSKTKEMVARAEIPLLTLYESKT